MIIKWFFGQASASDFTIHKDEARKQRYINRHNNGKFGPFLKVNGDDKFYKIKYYVDIDRIDLEAAISIVDDYENKQFRYNNSSLVLHDGEIMAHIPRAGIYMVYTMYIHWILKFNFLEFICILFL